MMYPAAIKNEEDRASKNMLISNNTNFHSARSLMMKMDARYWAAIMSRMLYHLTKDINEMIFNKISRLADKGDSVTTT